MSISTSINGRCKLDNGMCRDYYCNEAPLDKITNEAMCASWGIGCIPRGNKGCWTYPLPDCSLYTGTAEECNSFKG